MRASFFVYCLLFFGKINSQECLPISGGELVKHEFYTLSYNEKHEQANWVHYKLDDFLISGDIERKDRFKTDPNVSTGSSFPSDYTGSGYDRGHLVPAADMKLNSISMAETFYMSNISPQLPGFNRGIWKRLETLVRIWAKESSVYVTTAGILNNNISTTIGVNKVSVPKRFFKIIYSPSDQKMIGFLIPNEKSSQDLKSFVINVDDIEGITGIDFFSELPDDLENYLERGSSSDRWIFYDNHVKSKKNKIDSNKDLITRCAALTKSNVQCKRNSTKFSSYCWQHN